MSSTKLHTPAMPETDTTACVAVDTVRLVPATPMDIEQIQAWATAEVGLPGVGDSATAPSPGPQGVLAGYIGERLVSAVVIADHGRDLAFCGSLLVDPDLRQQGIGTQTWGAAIVQAGARSLAADVPSHLTEKARRMGFTEEIKILRYAGPMPPARASDPCVAPLNPPTHLPQLVTLDAECFRTSRPEFAAAFATATGHHTLVYTDVKGNVRGYGTVRTVQGTAQVGPLYAERSYEAAALFDALCRLARVAGADAVGIDVPELSRPGRAIASTRGLWVRSHLQRMYRPGDTRLKPAPFDQLCAITCLGLG